MVDSILRKIACPALCAGALALSCLAVLPSCGSTSGAPGSTPAEPPQPLTEEEASAADDALRMEVTWEPEKQKTGTFVRSQIRVYAKAGGAEPVYTLDAGSYRREVLQ